MGLLGWQSTDESSGVKMAISNITPVPNSSPLLQGRGAVIHSVAPSREYRVHYGVQSATFVQTVFPGQATGTYRVGGLIHSLKAPIYANYGTKTGMVSSSRAAGSPTIPYPPSNASAYYSNQCTRIIPHPSYRLPVLKKS